jgi:short-subunit dehydrogenase
MATTETPSTCALGEAAIGDTTAYGKNVVITGVSTGIGWGTTKVLVSKDFACSVRYASRLTPIVYKESSATVSCLS